MEVAWHSTFSGLLNVYFYLKLFIAWYCFLHGNEYCCFYKFHCSEKFQLYLFFILSWSLYQLKSDQIHIMYRENNGKEQMLLEILPIIHQVSFIMTPAVIRPITYRYNFNYLSYSGFLRRQSHNHSGAFSSMHNSSFQ